MQINIQGMANQELMYNNAITVLNDLLNRLELPEGTKFLIEDLSFKVAFEIDGKLQYASINREVGGKEVPEIFQVAVKLDKDGQIEFMDDNEEESFYDGYTLAQAAGVAYQYEGIESPYSNDDLEVISYIESSDKDEEKVMAVTYKIKGDEDHVLIRYYKGEKIVAEKLVDNEVIENI